MRRALLVLLLATGCTTTDEAVRQNMRPWIGQPVRSFAEQHSLVPTATNDTTDGRTFIFQKPGAFGSSCGVTVWGVPGGSEYVIRTMASSCPPGSF